ncbi:aspartate-tRNA ligase [Metarhizium brunneum]
MALVELREERNWAIQGVVAAIPEGEVFSQANSEMDRRSDTRGFCPDGGGTIEKPLVELVSVCVSNYEPRISKCYCFAPGAEVLAMRFVVCL